MRADWVDTNPKAALAIMMAIMEAQQWCEKMENKQEMAEIIGRRQWFNVPVPDIIGRIKGDINYGHGRTAQGHQPAHEVLGQDRRGRPTPGRASTPGSSPRTSAGASSSRRSTSRRWSTRTNRSDLWIEAAKTLGIAGHPTGDSRGVETFFDGKVFDPADPQAYLQIALDQATDRLIRRPQSRFYSSRRPCMNMPMLKAEAAAAHSVRAAGGSSQAQAAIKPRRAYSAGALHGRIAHVCRR